MAGENDPLMPKGDPIDRRRERLTGLADPPLAHDSYSLYELVYSSTSHVPAGDWTAKSCHSPGTPRTHRFAPKHCQTILAVPISRYHRRRDWLLHVGGRAAGRSG